MACAEMASAELVPGGGGMWAEGQLGGGGARARNSCICEEGSPEESTARGLDQMTS